MRRLARTIVLIVLGVVTATAVIEIGLRLIVASPLWRVLPVPEVALYGPDPYTGYRHRPDVRGVWTEENRSWVVTSHLGLRDRERPFARTAAPRAVVIGNSLLEALQVDLRHTAVFVAEKLLQKRYKGAEVVNLGLAGASPAVEVARLKSLGVSLKPDVAVVLVPVSGLFSSETRDDSAYAGYRRDRDGRFTLHYGFRKSSGYKFRTSRLGHALYWLLDHSEVMRVYNMRKNVGLFAELPRAAAPGKPPGCFEPGIPKQLSLWRDHRPARANSLLDAVIRDLAAIQRQHRIKIIFAVTDMTVGCPDQAATRRATLEAMRARLEAAGLQMADFDGLVAARVGAANVRLLHGFRSQLGHGHLNVKGNRVYGKILARIISDALAGTRQRGAAHL